MEKENKGKGKGKSSCNLQLNLNAPIAVKTNKVPMKNISIISEKIFVTCQSCNRIDLKDKVLQCSSCKFYYHKRCCPKNYKENIPDHEDSELCVQTVLNWMTVMMNLLKKCLILLNHPSKYLG